MGYPLRPDIPGATYHVTSKGTNGEPIFFDDQDRSAFLWHLDRVVLRQSWLVLAYCLMTNHYHLVLRVPNGGLSEGMRLLNRGYSARTNQRHGRAMHLFRQRFFSKQITSDEHLLESCRYVVLNPPRAGMCDAPDLWPWSSYRSTAGIEIAPAFLAVGEVLSLFGRDRYGAERVYREFVRSGLGPVSDTGVNASTGAGVRR